MKCKAVLICALALVVLQFEAWASPPVILSLQRDGALAWTSNFSNDIAVVETSTNLKSGSWSPYFYDLASNQSQVTQLPPSNSNKRFYRLAVQTNVPDKSLLIHLTFDNDFTNSGMILDVSGYGNHALQYGPTNFPDAAVGPDGSIAGRFHRFGTWDGGGDYGVIPWTTNSVFYRLTNGTVLAWAYYTTNSYGASTIIDASWYQFPYSWFLGRDYSYGTRFGVFDTNGNAIHVVSYPDNTTTFATGGWHYYGVTWDGTNFVGYYDGVPFSTNSQAGFPALIPGGHPWAQWIAIGCRTHDGTPQLGDADGLPNNGWMDGGIDDVRIYNRALSADEISALYNSFKK